MPGRQPLSFPGAVLAVAGSLALSACGGADAVRVAAPSPGSEAAAACTALHEVLPSKVDDAKKRAVDPPSDLVTAWGEPPVVLRCGVPAPAGLRPMSQLQVVNGVDWFMTETPAARVFTTTGRVANLELTVPLDHEPAVGPLVDIAADVTAHVRLVK